MNEISAAYAPMLCLLPAVAVTISNRIIIIIILYVH